MCHLNLCIKKWGSPSSFRRKRPVISLNCSAFIENLSSSDGVHAPAHADHAKKWCAERMCNAIEGNHLKWKPSSHWLQLLFFPQQFWFSFFICEIYSLFTVNGSNQESYHNLVIRSMIVQVSVVLRRTVWQSYFTDSLSLLTHIQQKRVSDKPIVHFYNHLWYIVRFGFITWYIF